MTEQERVYKAGADLLRLRELSELDQRGVQKKTGNKVSAQQVSKLELGKVKRPSMRDLVLLGAVYGLTPNQVATLYGYWQPSEAEEEPEDPRVTTLKQTAKLLPPLYRERLLNAAEVSAALYRSEAERAAIIERAEERSREA